MMFRILWSCLQLFTSTESTLLVRDAASTNDSTRSFWDIVSSCLTTMFACTWIVVHSNIPAPGDSAIVVPLRRLAIIGNVLIAPEAVVMWATRQYLGSLEISKRHKARGWTKTNAFFAIMGGFALFENGVHVRTLEITDLERLELEGMIDWPTITAKEINDKSKGDYFSKAVVVLQTTWFIVQCIVRGAEKMVLTELEVVTLAFSVLTIMVYFMWWNKPLDVGVPSRVYLKKGFSSREIFKDAGVSEEDGSPESLPSPVVIDMEDGGEAQEMKPEETVNQIVPAAEQTLLSADTRENASTDASNSESNLLAQPADTTSSTSSDASPQPIIYVIYSFLFTISTVIFVLTYYLLVKLPLDIIYNALYFLFALLPREFFKALRDMGSCISINKKNTQRVPTFYSPVVTDDSLSFFLLFTVGTVFGAIHCIVWSFYFSSQAERLLWRISSVIITATLPTFILCAFLRLVKGGKMISLFLVPVLSIAYIGSRFCLLVLPLFALRDLPAGAYIDINWTAFIPHFHT